MIGLKAFLVLSAFMFSAGVACMLIRRNVIQILMGLELILNAAALNFAAFNHFGIGMDHPAALSGQIMSIFIIVLAAAEAVVALALILAIGRLFKKIDVNELKELKG